MESWLTRTTLGLTHETLADTSRYRPVHTLRCVSTSIGSFGKALVSFSLPSSKPPFTPGTPVGVSTDDTGIVVQEYREDGDWITVVAFKTLAGELNEGSRYQVRALPDVVSGRRITEGLKFAEEHGKRWTDVLFGEAEPRFRCVVGEDGVAREETPTEDGLAKNIEGGTVRGGGLKPRCGVEDQAAEEEEGESVKSGAKHGFVHGTDEDNGFDWVAKEEEAQLIKRGLNLSQRNAVYLALNAVDICAIHGPPGTGKTTTLIALMETILKRDDNAKILCCAPSNVAVDNLVHLIATGKPPIPVVRLGHPSRVDPKLAEYTLDHLLTSSDQAQLIQDARQELLETREFSRKKEIRKEIKRRERAIVREAIDFRRVVLSTISGASEVAKLTQSKFTHLIVDEAAQATEASVWIALRFLNEKTGVLILAGDHKQLPPTVLSDEALKQGLGYTMMQRLVERHPTACRLLAVQYRMNKEIMMFSSRELYDSKLVAHESVEKRRLEDIWSKYSKPMDEEDDDAEWFSPLVLIDTAGCNLNEEDMPAVSPSLFDESRANRGEVEIVYVHVGKLLKRGLNPKEIAVVTPYRAQLSAIKERFAHAAGEGFDAVDVRTVDGFQGQERDAIVLSMVRSNDSKQVGFLSDERRLNVALTRAKRHVCVIGDSTTLESHPFLKRLIEYFHEEGVVRSAGEMTKVVEMNMAEDVLLIDKPVVVPVQAVKPTKKKVASVATMSSSSSDSAAAKPSILKEPHTFAKPQDDLPRIGQSFAALNIVGDNDDNEDDDEGSQIIATPAVTQPPAKKKPQILKKKKTVPPVVAPAIDADAVDEDMEFLDQAIKQVNKCSFKQCDKITTSVYHDCSYCKLRFCLGHRHAEVHGCGDAARKNPFPNAVSKSSLKPHQRTYVQAQLQGKISEAEKARAAVVVTKKKA